MSALAEHARLLGLDYFDTAIGPLVLTKAETGRGRARASRLRQVTIDRKREAKATSPETAPAISGESPP